MGIFSQERTTQGGWKDWTPVITQSGNVTFSTNFARYATIGNTVVICANLGITGSGTAGQPIIITGPSDTTLQPRYVPNSRTLIGHIIINDYFASLLAISATDWRGRAYNTGAFLGAAPSFGLANGDIVSFQAFYERDGNFPPP